MVETQNKCSLWAESDNANQYLQLESTYLKQALGQVAGPRVMQLGNLIDAKLIADIDFPQLILADIDSQQSCIPTVSIDPAFIPIQTEMLSTMIVPHVLERHTMPHQVLREAHRVLIPEGHIILTGFNPVSVLGLQRYLSSKSVCPGRYVTVKRVSDWLQLLGFEIVGSATFQYAPLVKSQRLNKGLQFLNSIGDRWLPMFGGGYIITARKRVLNPTPLSKSALARVTKNKKQRRKLATASSTSKKETDK